MDETDANIAMALAAFANNICYGLPDVPGKRDIRSEYAHKTLSDDLQAEKIRKAEEKRKRKAKN